MPKEEEKKTSPKKEEEKTGKKNETEEYSFDLVSPGGCIILFVAASFDFLNLLCMLGAFIDGGIISQPVSFLISIFANIVFGIWTFYRVKSLKSFKKGSSTEKLKKIVKRKGKRFIFFGILDLIPYIGDIPSWTIFVFLELKSKK